MSADDKFELALHALRTDPRPTALIRAGRAGLETLAASQAMLTKTGAADEAALDLWLDGRTAAASLAECAEQDRAVAFDLDGGRRLVMSVRSLGAGCFNLRAHDVSNSTIAEIVSGLAAPEAGIIFLDPEGRVLAVNEACHRYLPKQDGFPRLGGTMEDLLRDAIRLGYLPQSAGREDVFVAEALRHIREGESNTHGILTASGCWFTSHSLFFPNGASIVLMADVTELRQELEQLISFARNTRRMIFCRCEAGSPFARVWGRDARTMLGARIASEVAEIDFWRECVHPDDRAVYETLLRRRVEEGLPFQHEFRFIHPETGELRWFLENAWVTVDRASGRRYLDNYLLDITDRKQAEAEIHHREDRFREFAEMATDWTFEADADMTITWLSDNFRHISGMSPDRFMGRDWAEITDSVLPELPEDEVPPWVELLAIWRRREPFRRVPLLFRFPGGNDRLVQVSGDPVYDHAGEYVGFRGVGRDVTSLVRARERAEAAMREAEAAMREAEAANRAKSEFIANMSHELRTPLNAIIGFANVMEQELFGPLGGSRYRGYAADIAASGQHLLSLVNDLLDLARIEAARVRLEPERIDICAEVDRILSLFRESAGGRHLRRTGEAPHGVWADRRSLRQMLINLVGNAIKFTSEEGVIAVEVEETETAVTLVVADDGIGMSPADIRTALEPFGRASSADIAGGTGLGLPLTKKLAELQDGSLTIRSEPKGGTRVILELPLPDDGAVVEQDRLSA